MSQYVFVDVDGRWLPAVNYVRKLGHSLTYVCASWHPEFEALWKPLADDCVVISNRSPECLTESLESIHSKRPIAGIVTDQDAWIEQVGLACTELAIPFTDHTAIATARDKLKTRRLLESNGFVVPRYSSVIDLDVEKAAAAVGFPCIVKPTRGSGSRLSYPLYEVAHLDWYVTEATSVHQTAPDYMHWVFDHGFVCEEFLSGPIISFAIAADRERYVALSSALHLTQDINPCMGFGSVLPLRTNQPRIESLQHYAIDVCRTMHLDQGIFDVEVIVSPSGPVLLEVNPRPMGGEMIAAFELATGMSLFPTILGVYSGSRAPPHSISPRNQALIYKLTANCAGSISESINSNAIEKVVPPSVQIKNYRLFPGRTVRELEVVGRLLTRTNDPLATFRMLEKIAERISNKCGIPFVVGEIPPDGAQFLG